MVNDPSPVEVTANVCCSVIGPPSAPLFVAVRVPALTTTAPDSWLPTARALFPENVRSPPRSLRTVAVELIVPDTPSDAPDSTRNSGSRPAKLTPTFGVATDDAPVVLIAFAPVRATTSPGVVPVPT